MKIKKGDKVRVMQGKDRGKEGPVDKIFPRSGRVVLAGINLYKRHTKPRAEGQKGGIIDLPRPLPVSNVSLICPKCKKPTRVGFELTSGKKERVCRKCHAII